MRTITPICPCVILFLALASSATAQVVVDSFDYGVSNLSEIDTLNGGSGWGGPWTEDVGEFEYVAATNLDYTAATGFNPALVGGLVQSTGADNSATRAFATPFGAGSTAWGSFLVSNNGLGNQFGTFNYMRIRINGDQNDQLGLVGTNETAAGAVDGVFNANVTVNGATTTLGTSNAGDVNLYIFKMETNFSGVNDRLSVWLNPMGTLSDEASLGTADFEFDTGDIWGDSIASISINGRTANTGSRMDDLRFGPNLTDVGVVPEPSVFGLTLGVAVFAFAATRRFRR